MTGPDTPGPGPSDPPPPRSPSSGRGADAVRIGGVVVILAVLVTVATGGAPVWVPRALTEPDRRTIVSVLIVLFALGAIAVTLISLARNRLGIDDDDPEAPVRRSILRSITPGVVLFVILGLWGIAGGRIGEPPAPDGPPDTVPPSMIGERLLFDDPRSSAVRGGAPGLEGAGSQGQGDPRLGLIVGLVLLAALTAGGVWWWSGRGATEEEEELDPEEDDTPADREATRRVVLHSIDEMLADSDPNTAVIGAYARLLEGLTASGAPRRAHEGPTEHLRRVLGTLEVRPDPLRDLVGLFEAARFSSTSLTDGHRDRALDALHAVADDLGPTGRPTVAPGTAGVGGAP